jgi:hypothetical protein
MRLVSVQTVILTPNPLTRLRGNFAITDNVVHPNFLNSQAPKAKLLCKLVRVKMLGVMSEVNGTNHTSLIGVVIANS